MSKYGEPWIYVGYGNYIEVAPSEDNDYNGEIILNVNRALRNQKRGERVVVCVNAFAGIEDPEAFMTAVRNIVETEHGGNLGSKTTYVDMDKYYKMKQMLEPSAED